MKLNRPVKKAKLKRREEKPRAKLKRREEKESIQPRIKLRRRGEEKETPVRPRLNRLKRGTIYISDDGDPICYVCGRIVKQEYAFVKKKIKEDGQLKIKNIPYTIPPLIVGYTKEGVPIYRHRKKACRPFSDDYIENLRDYCEKSLVHAYDRGRKSPLKGIIVDEDEEE